MKFNRREPESALRIVANSESESWNPKQLDLGASKLDEKNSRPKGVQPPAGKKLAKVLKLSSPKNK